MAPSQSKSSLSRLYKQTKKKKTTKSNPKLSASSSRPTKKSKKQSTADVIPHDDFDAKEEALRQFDLNLAYGPCIGISRLDRWERAKALGLDPPQVVLDLLISSKVQQQSLWGNRIS